MFGSQPISSLPISTLNKVEILIISPVAQLITRTYDPTIAVVVGGDAEPTDFNYYLPGTDAIIQTKPSTIAITFIYGKYIYSKVKLNNTNIKVELLNKETENKAQLTLMSLDKISGRKDITLETLKKFPKHLSVIDGKIITL